jgi:large subunit ribosomal protein L3
MSEAQQQAETKGTDSVTELTGLYAFKVGMTQVNDDKGQMVPVTVLRYEPWVVSQIKTKENDGYEAVQIACRGRKESRSPKAQRDHLKNSGLKGGAYFVHEIRGSIPQGAAVGVPVSVSCLKKGDTVKATARSKGKGFQGSVKRWNNHGGPGAHGSTFHRQPGSSGNRTWPGRIMKGKHFPGHLGDEITTVTNLEIVDVLADENLILVKGSVPGARESLVRLIKQ